MLADFSSSLSVAGMRALLARRHQFLLQRERRWRGTCKLNNTNRKQRSNN